MTGLDLRHYAPGPVALDRDRSYEQRAPRFSFNKPRGFWVSVKGADDWPTWCREEGFALDRQVEHTVRVAPTARILHLETIAALVDFTETYGVQPTVVGLGTSIHWEQVATEFDGIIIAPYQWPCRMSLDWYYGWDVASGCIWNLAAIESVDLLAEVTA